MVLSINCIVDELLSSYVSKKKKESNEILTSNTTGECDPKPKVVEEMKADDPRLVFLLQRIMKEDVSSVPTTNPLNREFVNTILFLQFAARQEGSKSIRDLYTLFSQSPSYLPPHPTSSVKEKPVPAISTLPASPSSPSSPVLSSLPHITAPLYLSYSPSNTPSLLYPPSPPFFTTTLSFSTHSPSTQSLFLTVLRTIRSEFDMTIVQQGLLHHITFYTWASLPSLRDREGVRSLVRVLTIVPVAVTAEVGHVLLQLLRHALLSAKEARCLVQELVLTLAARIKEVAGMQRSASDVRVMSLLRVLCDVVSELRVRREASLAMNAEMINALRECVKEMNNRQEVQCRVMMMVGVV